MFDSFSFLVVSDFDEIGQIQPAREQVAEFWNQPPDQPPRVRGQDNSIQPWRIDSDGSVHNAIA